MITGRLARLTEWYWSRPTPWVSPHSVPEDKGEIGVAAQALLDDPVLHLALDRVQAKLTATWLATAPGERQAREAAYRLHWAAEQFKSELRIMIANASVAGRQ